MSKRLSLLTAYCHFVGNKQVPTAAFATGTASSSSCSTSSRILSLQTPHPERTPAAMLQELALDCQRLNVTEFDAYGDFDDVKQSSLSFLRRFEREIANEFGMPDAVFVPSGVMAQSIALLIHDKQRRKKKGTAEQQQSFFACHHTSHLLLHEQEAYRELLHMEPIIVSTRHNKKANGDISIPPMMFVDVQNALNNRDDHQEVSTLILELPHRELGGTLTPFDDMVQMRDYCHERNMAFHCDGARIFEATVGYDKSLQEVAALFDSIYISFYKGLGGISGAMLLGPLDFCQEARIWLRRFGGNLYTLLPYAVSGWAGYRRNWCLQGRGDDDDNDDNNILSFGQKTAKLQSLVAALSSHDAIQKHVAFDPKVPQTNMVHGYLRASVDVSYKALDEVQAKCGIQVLRRVKPVQQQENEPACQAGYRSKFEWVIGENNGNIDDDVFLKGWSEFAAALQKAKGVTSRNKEAAS